MTEKLTSVTGKKPARSSRLTFSVMELAPFPMATVGGAPYLIRYVNPAFCHLVDKRAQQLIGKPFCEIAPEANKFTALFGSVFCTGKPASHTQQQAFKPNSKFWTYTMWPVIVGKRVVGVTIQVAESAHLQEKTQAMNEALLLGSVRQHELTEAAESSNALLQTEIIERKQAEIALRESEQRYRTLFELGPVAVYSCDASGVIRNFNRHAVELWGGKPMPSDDRARFCGSFKLFHMSGRPMARQHCPMAAVVNGKISEVRDLEMLIGRPDGTRVSVVVNIRALKNEREEIIGAINCFYDITERKESEAAQRRLAVMTATNRKLELEIAQRQEVEKALKLSEQHQSWLLEESRLMQDELQVLSRQVLSAQEEERKRISRELHDVVAQSLTGISVRLATLQKQAVLEPNSVQRSVVQAQRLVEQSANLVHQFARDLRPTMLDDLGLIPALHSFMKDFKKETGIQVSLSAFAAIDQVSGDKRIVFYRVTQEALSNVARHAQASRVDVSLQQFDGIISLIIKDDGKGFRANQLLRADGNKRLGLLGMRERLEMVGGTYNIQSVPREGTTITARIPTDLVHANNRFKRCITKMPGKRP